jgi:hypothetical protein
MCVLSRKKQVIRAAPEANTDNITFMSARVSQSARPVATITMAFERKSRMIGAIILLLVLDKIRRESAGKAQAIARG